MHTYGGAYCGLQQAALKAIAEAAITEKEVSIGVAPFTRRISVTSEIVRELDDPAESRLTISLADV
jgi:hypothetical protein